MTRRALLLAVLWLPFALPALLPATAQDRAGRDTPSDWVVTHYKPFGLWDSICDARDEGGERVQRCYLRYVEVFSTRPEFGAQFIFVTPDHVEIGTERGTRFAEDGMRITDAAGARRHAVTRIDCLRGRDCVFRGEERAELLRHMAEGAAFLFVFSDRYGKPRHLSWSLTRFAEALADMRREAAARHLLP